MFKFKKIFLFSISALFFIFCFLNNARDVQAVNYFTLEPSEKSVATHINLPYEGYGVNVILKEFGQIKLDQKNITYKWNVANSSIISLRDEGFSSGCPYGINAPCPNMHGDIRGLRIGETVVSVNALLNGQEIATTSFNAIVSSSYYSLEPSEYNIIMPLSTAQSGYGVNLLLNGEDQYNNKFLILDQSSVSYSWKIVDENTISIEDTGFNSGCPYNIKSPCPNLHGLIRGKQPGTTNVEVKAFINNVEIASTTFSVKVEGSLNYSLEPSENSAITHVHLPYEGYGINVLLKKDNKLLIDQRDIKYEWISENTQILSVTANGFTSGCPYNINNPCPNLHADLKGLNEGATQIKVKAFKNSELIAETSIQVQISNSSFYTLLSSETQISMPISTPQTGYGVNVILNGKDSFGNLYLILDQRTIKYKWLVENEKVLSLADSGFTSGCPYNINNPCPNLHADLKGLTSGSTKVFVRAQINNSQIAETSFTVNVVGSLLNDTKNKEGYNEKPVKEEINNLSKKVEEISKNLEVQKKKIEKNENLLDKIMNFLKRLFGFSTEE